MLGIEFKKKYQVSAEDPLCFAHFQFSIETNMWKEKLNTLGNFNLIEGLSPFIPDVDKMWFIANKLSNIIPIYIGPKAQNLTIWRIEIPDDALVEVMIRDTHESYRCSKLTVVGFVEKS